VVAVGWQRDFAVFGGEFLMLQDQANLRGFFRAFFLIPTELWTVGGRCTSPPFYTQRGG
jgi:hypothetical protein